MKVLSPVKNLKSAKIVIQSGADEIFLASPNFGARVNASIENEELKDIIEYANLYEVDSFITFNTVIYDDEINNFFKEIDQIYLMGATGVILQDISFVKILTEKYPDLEVHASTQISAYNSLTVNQLENLGFSRVILPREMKSSEIRKLRENTNVDLEVFVHGALCVSFSGQCYDSSLLDQKSANRGRCSQYCRMPQNLMNRKTNASVYPDKYPLNLKDLNNLNLLDQYKDLGISSLKIEGRLKDYDYAYLTTKNYKEKTVSLLNNVSDSKKNLLPMENVYNRTFSNGKFADVQSKELVNLNRPNNNGIKIGQVVEVSKNTEKKYGYYRYVILINVKTKLNLQDNIRYVNTNYEEGQLIEQFESIDKNSYLIYSNCSPVVGTDIYRTLNYQMKLNANQMKLNNDFLKIIDVKVLFQNNKINLIFNDNFYETEIEFTKAVKHELTIHDLKESLEAVKGNKKIKVGKSKVPNNIFIPKSKLKELRKYIFSKTENNKEVRESSLINVNLTKEKIKNNEDIKYYIEVSTKSQYEAITNLHLSNCFVLINNFEFAKTFEKNEDDYFVFPRIVNDDNLMEINDVVNNFSKVCVNDYGTLVKFAQDKEVITNFTMNSTNLLNKNFLIESGASKVIGSIELNKEKINSLADKQLIINVYGKIPVMLLEYCPINLNKKSECGSCRLCRGNDYYLLDEFKREFPLKYADFSKLELLSHKTLDLTGKINEMNDFGVNNIHLRFTTESKEATEGILKNIISNKKLDLDTTTGTYYKEIL